MMLIYLDLDSSALCKGVVQNRQHLGVDIILRRFFQNYMKVLQQHNGGLDRLGRGQYNSTKSSPTRKYVYNSYVCMLCT